MKDENNLCTGNPCDHGCDKGGKCDFCHAIVHMMAEQEKAHNERIAKYEQLLLAIQEQTKQQIIGADQRVEKIIDIMGKLNDYVMRIETLHNNIKSDEDCYVERLKKKNDELMLQNTTLTNLVSLVCTPSGNSHGNNIHINK